MRGLMLMLMLAAVTCAHAQWNMQQSHTTASLRGIHNAGGGVVWASGTQGTVLHTTDDGQTWQTCPIPQGAEKLDFRGIQAFDAATAIVMSSGTGALSRIYKTVDACRTWRLVFTNPDENGFWDALQFKGASFGVVIGDQVQGHFPLFTTNDAGETWKRMDLAIAADGKNQSFFAASNTSLLLDPRNANFYLITGGGKTSFLTVRARVVSSATLPLAVGETAGGFSLAARRDGPNLVMVAVGGDYKAPERRTGTAAYWIHDGGWHAPDTAPGGYRSAVAYYAPSKTWIAVGPTGTDFSSDDGRHWRASKPGSGQTPDAGKNWNALSLPFVAGPDGRIGKLAAVE